MDIFKRRTFRVSEAIPFFGRSREDIELLPHPRFRNILDEPPVPGPSSPSPREDIPVPVTLAVFPTNTTVSVERTPWHPKMTAYRLLILATTIGLGTAKVISSMSGNVYIPITLEWVAGVVIFLTFHSVAGYDSDPCPQYLSWFFKTDCMDFIWPFLSVAFEIQRPQYSTDEVLPKKGRNYMGKPHTPVFTLYRFLVSGTVVVFGTMKAMFGYYGFSAAANWVDWMLGVIATSLLYYLGLYEYNSAGRWPSLFSTDHGIFVFGVRTLILLALGIITGLAWAGGCAWFLVIYWHDPSFDLSSPKRNGTPSSMKPTPIDHVHDFSIRIMMSFMIILYLFMGIGGIVLLFISTADSRRTVMRELRNSAAPRIITAAFAPFRIIMAPLRPLLRAGRRHALVSVQHVRARSSEVLDVTASARYTTLRLLLNTIFFLAAIFLIGSVSFSIFGMGYRTPPPKTGAFEWLFITFIDAAFMFVGVLGFGGACFLARQMLLPFYHLLHRDRRKFQRSFFVPL